MRIEYNEIKRRTHLGIHLVPLKRNTLSKGVHDGSIDGIAAIMPAAIKGEDLLSTKAHLHAYPAIFSYKNNQFKQADDLIGKNVSYPEGAHFFDFLLEAYKNQIQLMRPENELKSLQLLYSGKADYALGLSISNYLIYKYQLLGITPVHVFWDNPVQSVCAIRSDWPLLVTILNKAIATFSDAELNALIAKWVFGESEQRQAGLSPEEEVWIARHPVLTLAVDNTYPPLNFTNDEGEMAGLSIDLINAFTGNVGLSVDYQGSIWSIAINKAFRHEVDGIVNADATKERKTALNFSLPYVTLPSGLVTLKTTREFKSFGDLGEISICVKNNSSHLELIRQKTSAIIIPIETLEEGLEMVIKGEAVGVFDDVSVLGYLIAKYNFVNLKINFIHYDDVVGVSRLGLRNDDPMMLGIINKAVLSLSKHERDKIQSKWLSLVEKKTVIEKQFDWKMFFKIIIPILFLAIMLYIFALFHNRRLKHAVEIRTRDLMQSKEQFRVLIDHAADAVFVHDFDGRLLTVNRLACQSLGCSAHELLHLKVQDIDAAAGATEELRKFWKQLVPEQPVTIEGLHKRKNGETFPVEIRVGVIEFDGRPAVLALARDMTQRKKEERNRILLAAVIEQAYEAVIITDIQSVIQYVNPAFENITGYSREEVVGRNPAFLKNSMNRHPSYIEMWDTISKGEVWRGHITNNRKDGKRLDLETTVIPIKEAGGEIINFAAINRDVTQVQNLERQLRQAQKMEAIGTLAGGISHDFNNILSAIIGYAELMEFSMHDEEKASKYLKQIFSAGNRAKELVQQILTFSRQTEHELKPVLVKLIVKEALKLLRASLPSTIEIRQTIESDGLVIGDPTRIHQIIMNLCTNAGQAMQMKGGTLQVKLRDVELDSAFTSHYPDLKPGKYINLIVSDTGYGIPRENLERIFDPFFTTKAQGEGTGMGLSVVHGIVKSYDGMISAYSEPGVGSTFKVYFPAVENSVEPEKEKEAAIPGGTESILLIDDEPALIDIGMTMLQRLGYHVTAETSSIAALELFTSRPDQFDLVLTDLTMPGMTGDKLAERLLSVRQDIPIILCTGFSHHMTEEKITALGVKGLLMKPFVRSQLSQIIRKALDEAK